MNLSKRELLELLSRNPGLHIAQKQLDELPEDAKEHKYHAQPQWYDGIYFDSLKEVETYADLKLLKRAGAIRDFQYHPAFKLSDGTTYEADFRIIHTDGREQIKECKGMWLPEARRKMRKFKKEYPDVEIIIS